MEPRKKASVVAAALTRAQRARLGRLHFRSAIRLAYQNNYWLEDTEGEQLGSNVAKNIQILTRKKRKGQFSLIEKAIMKVPQEKRTEEEKQVLRRVLGAIKCFRKYPHEVKKDLAAITYFAEYNADRMIVRQGDEAIALYFVITGTARVLVTQYDPLADKMTEATVKIKEAGDMFGELALLVSSKRSATIITNERSEFLIVKQKDFDRVLRETVLKEWEEIKKALNMFEYFKSWDERYVQESCMMSKMRQYEENTLILSEEYGDSRLVYFIIEGSVDLLECVEMKVTTYKNKITYSLHNPYEAPPLTRLKSVTVDLGKLLKDRLEPERSLSDLKLRAGHSMRFSAGSVDYEEALTKSFMKLQETEAAKSKKKGKKYKKSIVCQSYSETLMEMSPQDRVNYVKQFESRVSRVTCQKEIPVTTLETYFIRVAKMGPLGTFNIGEHLNSRYYVARSKLKVLAIPQYWLFSRDKPTWNNISIFLRTRLSTRQQLYEQFAKRRSWLVYRKECYFDIANQSRKTNINCINNVPLSIRLGGDLEYYVCSRKLPPSKCGSSNSDVRKDDDNK